MYKIITDCDLGRLERTINLMFKDGWVLKNVTPNANETQQYLNNSNSMNIEITSEYIAIMEKKEGYLITENQLKRLKELLLNVYDHLNIPLPPGDE